MAGIAFLMILLLAPEMGSNSDINSLLASVEPNLSKAMLILIHISFVGAAVRIGRKVDFRRARLRYFLFAIFDFVIILRDLFSIY